MNFCCKIERSSYFATKDKANKNQRLAEIRKSEILVGKRVKKFLRRRAGRFQCSTPDIKSMCVSIPGKVVLIKGKRAKIKQAEHCHWVDVSALEVPAREGDYLIVYQGAAINKISSEQAKEILGLLGKPVSAQRR